MPPPVRSSAARVDPAPPRAPSDTLRLDDVPAELRDNAIVRFLATMTPAEAALLDEAAEIDRDGPPPGFGLDDE